MAVAVWFAIKILRVRFLNKTDPFEQMLVFIFFSLEFIDFIGSFSALPFAISYNGVSAQRRKNKKKQQQQENNKKQKKDAQ